jgi:hypothetical protein
MIFNKNYRQWMFGIGVVVILGSALVSLAGTPENATDPGQEAQAVIEGPVLVEGQIRIAGSVLRPRGSEPTFSSTAGGCIYALTEGWQVWNAPVYLPQGAMVTQMRFYFSDGSASADSWAWFTAYDYQGFVEDEWGAPSFGSTGSGYVTIEDINHVIDYTQYSYVVNWRPVLAANNMKACGFRIWYTMP